MGRSDSYSSASSSSYSSSSSSSGSSRSSASRRSRRRGGEKRSRDNSRDRRDDRRRRTDSPRLDRDRGGRSSGRRYPERPPHGTFCHACKRPNHWTVECEIVVNDPARFPHINTRDGCPICGKVGHKYTRCDGIKFSCRSCGDLHDTRVCPFDYTPVEFHEFFDEEKGFPYYFCTTTKKIEWVYTGKPSLDVLLWHCDECKLLIRDNVEECVLCHGRRKRRKPRRGRRGGRGDKGASGAEGSRKAGERKGDGADGAGEEEERPIPEGLKFADIGNWIDDTDAAVDILGQVAEVAADGGCPESAISEMISAVGAAPTSVSAPAAVGLASLTSEALRQLQ